MCRHPSLDAGNRTVTGDKRSIRGLIAGLAVALLALIAPAAASAAFPPGQNGVIAFTSFDARSNPALFGVWTINPDGTGARRLIAGTDTYKPTFFPNGRQLAVVRRDSDDSTNFYSIGTDGGPLTALTTFDRSSVDDPAITPEGNTLAFTGFLPAGGSNDLWMMRIGLDPIRVRSTPGERQYTPEFSPDGRRLVFRRIDEHQGDGDQSGINSIDLTTDFETRLTTDLFDRYPAYSPGGDTIVFVRSTGTGGDELWAMNPNGTNERQIPMDISFNQIETPRFSPDGRFIVFGGSHFQKQDLDLYVINADGTGIRNITAGRPTNDFSPSWQTLPRGSGGVAGEVGGTRCAAGKITIRGTGRRDVISGTRGTDVIAAGPGADTVFGRGGRDVICGDQGRDILLGNGGRDLLLGGRGRDGLWGGPRRDALFGGPGLDQLTGNGGRDFYGPGRDLIFP